jgi:hypothetical protein
MEKHIRTDMPSFSPYRWFLLALSVLIPLILLSAILPSAGSAKAELLISEEVEPRAPASMISGAVVAPGGSPITDSTTVCLDRYHPEEDWWEWGTCADTESDGSFGFTETIPSEFLPGEFVFSAWAPWYGYFDALPITLTIENDVDPIDLGVVYLTYASFEGTVYEPDGTTPAQWGWVSVEKLEEDGWWCPVAGGGYDEYGWYAVGSVPDGDFSLIALPPDDSLLWQSEPVTVTVPEGSQYVSGATQYISLTLQDPNVYGWVVHPDGSPAEWIISGTVPLPENVIGQAWVKAVSADWTFDAERPTASSGEFGLLLPPGDYEVWAEPREEMASWRTHSLPRHVTVPDTGTLVLPAGPLTLTYPSVAGHVLDPVGDPIPGCLSVWLENTAVEWVTEDWYCPEQDWPYRLGGVPGGDYWLMTEGLPEYGFLPAEPLLIHVEAGSQYDPDATLFFDLFLEPAAGPLTVEVVDSLGTPIAARVVLMDEWGYEEWQPSQPGDPALFQGMKPGEYWVQAWPLGADIPALANSEPVPLSIDVGLVEITLELLAPNVIGVIRTPEGDPLPPAYDWMGGPVHPAEVQVHNEDWTVDIWAATNVSGAFSLALPDDYYVLKAHPFANLVLTYTKSVPMEFWTPDPGDPLLDLGTISLTHPCVQGWVVDPDGNRVSAWVDLWSVDESYWEGDETLWYPPDETKPFRFGGLLPGGYAVRSGPPYDDPGAYASSNVHDFTVPGECGEEISLTLEVANFIGYLLLPPDDPWCPECPVPGAEVLLRSADATLEDWTNTDENGRFAFSGLEPAAYVVKVFLPAEYEFEWNPPVPEPFVLVSGDQVVERTLYLQPVSLNKHVIGVVVYDDGSPVGDANGDGVGDALVYAYHEDTGYWAHTLTEPDGSYGLDLKGGLWWVGVEPVYPGVDWYFDPAWEQPVEFPYDPELDLTEPVTLTVAPAEYFQVTGVVTTPSGAPIVPGTVEVALCDDEGHCFGNLVEPDGDFTLWALPGAYRFWTHVDPDIHLLPPLENGFDVFVNQDLNLGLFWLRAIGDRTASVSGRVIISSTGDGLSGVGVEAWTDIGDWNRTETVEDGHYVLDLFPGYWHGGPKLSQEQEEQYVVLPPRQREGYLAAGETISNVNFYLLHRDATIEGHVVDISTTLPITDMDAIVFAERCPGDVTLPCYVVAEDEVRDGAFELKVPGNYTYTLGIWIPGGGYMPGPPVDVFVARGGTAYADVAVIEAGTRIHGNLEDTDLNDVYIPASVYGNEPVSGFWVEDFLWPEKEPYEFNLYVPTPVSEPMTWTLWLGVDPHTGYVPDPAHPSYEVVVHPGMTDIPQDMTVRELDTLVVGEVVMFDGTTLVPAPYVWVFAKGIEGTDSEGLYFEVQADEQGNFAMYVLPGRYKVNAYLPPHMADDFLPPLPKEWGSVDDNPVVLRFRPRPTGTQALEISGGLTVSPTGALEQDTPITVLGWSREQGHSQVTGTLADGYRLPVVSDTVWYVWAVYEDPDDDVLYFSEERRVTVRTTGVSGVNLMLERADFPLPDTVCESFDPLVFERISLPTWPGVPEPLIEIQAGTMPVSGTVEVCATPVLGVPGGFLLVGFAYEIEARDSQGNLITEDFNKSVRLIFYYNADMLGDADPEELEPAFFSTARQEWVPLEDVFIDPDDWFVTGKTDHFSRIGVRTDLPPWGESEIYLPLVLRNFAG